MSYRTMAATVITAGAAVLALAACGSSGSSAGSTAGSTAGHSATSSTQSASSSMSSMSSMSSAPTASTATVQNGAITLDVTNKLRFMPSTIMVPKAGPVMVTIKDTGSYPHNISVPSLHKTSSSVTGDVGNTTTTITFDFPRAGRYPFECTYHSDAGMTGVFVVG